MAAPCSKLTLSGQAMHFGFVAQDLLGVGAAVRRGHIDAVAGLHSLDTLSHRLDDATRVDSRCVRQIGFRRVGSGADVSVYRIHAGGMDAHHHLSRDRDEDQGPPPTS